ncbi:hypothetical protein V8C37DRAFT_368341 [Trichoderma ceciliae]
MERNLFLMARLLNAVAALPLLLAPLDDAVYMLGCQFAAGIRSARGYELHVWNQATICAFLRHKNIRLDQEI